MPREDFMAVVKTAISIDEAIFRQAEEIAGILNVSRSRAFALAMEDFARRQANKALLEKINASYDDTPDPEEDRHLKAAQRSFLKVADKW